MDIEEDLKALERRWQEAGVDLDVYLLTGSFLTGSIHLSRIIVPKSARGRGLGTRVMEDLTALADHYGLRITLSPATDFGGTSVDRLKRFYRRFGFVSNKGRHKDFRIGATMYRQPREPATMTEAFGVEKLTDTQLDVLRLIAEGRALGDYVPRYRPGAQRGRGAFPVTIAARAAAKLEQMGLVERRPRGEYALTRAGADALGAPRHALEEVTDQHDQPNLWYHLTDRARFRLDPRFAPEDNAIAIVDRSGRPGIYLGQSVEAWVNGYGYWRPFVVELDVDPSVVEDPGVHGRYGGEMFVPASSFDKLTILRVIPLDAHAREVFGEAGWIERELGFEFDTGEPIPRPGRPGWSETYKKFRGYRYPGPDVRDMPLAQVNHLKRQLRQVKR